MSARHHSSEREQLDLFRALPGDLALRDALDGGDATIPVVVSHGRVLSAWLASRVAMPAERADAATIWTRLRMPDAFLLRRERDGWLGERFDGDRECGG